MMRVHRLFPARHMLLIPVLGVCLKDVLVNVPEHGLHHALHQHRAQHLNARSRGGESSMRAQLIFVCLFMFSIVVNSVSIWAQLILIQFMFDHLIMLCTQCGGHVCLSHV